jgi:L-ascorbate metabolism protein UlaG (beta-lactamase superfamily)
MLTGEEERAMGTGEPLMVMNAKLAMVTVLALVLASCGNREVIRPDPQHPHHTSNGYANADGSSIGPGLADVIGFYWQMWRVERKPVPADLRPIVPDLGYLRDNREETSLTWITHATTLLQIGGVNVLMDPQFSERASPFTWAGPKRRTQPAMSIAELPPIDVVVISHDHYDHLDQASVKALVAKCDPTFVVPLGVDAIVTDWGARHVVALDWWESTHLFATTAGNERQAGEVDVTLVPAHHWSKRGLFDRNERLWGGFVLKSPQFKAYYSGDTGYAEIFKEIGQRLGPFDLALLPVGAYEPRDFMKQQHVNPEEAVRIHRDVQAKQSIAVHWGTWDLSLEALDAPRTALPAALDAAGVARDEFALFRLGETGMWRVEKRADNRGQTRTHPKRQWRKGEAR